MKMEKLIGGEELKVLDVLSTDLFRDWTFNDVKRLSRKSSNNFVFGFKYFVDNCLFMYKTEVANWRFLFYV